MYDRAVRFFDSVLGSTSANIGPGSYNADIPSKVKLQSDGYAPFLSLSNRETFPTPVDQLIAAPGPGHYDPVSAQYNVKGGNSIDTKETRFKPVQWETPGPTSYDILRQETEENKKTQTSFDIWRATHTANRIKYQRKPDAPSIPSHEHAYGYEECADGSLKKQKPPSKDDSIGPAFYAPKYEQATSTQQYRGVHFGKMSSKRTNFGGRVGPAPGDYDPHRPASSKLENTNVHGDGGPDGTKRYEAHIPRYSEAIIKESEKMNIPGPGQYEVRRQFDKQTPKTNLDGVDVEHPPFLSQTKRFLPSTNAVPPPGSYDDPRTALTSLNKVTGVKKSPFGQTSVRFHDEKHSRSTPGPASYISSGMGTESMRKAYLESTRRGIFGTTSARTHSVVGREEIDLPGPAHYQLRDRQCLSRYTQQSAYFASGTTRLTGVPEITAEMPAPGSYNVHHSYDKSQVKTTIALPRSKTAKQKHSSFLSAATRFSALKDVGSTSVDPDNPGPGTYDQKSTLRPRCGVSISSTKRFSDVIPDNPGPGTYEMSPLVQESVLRGTFNATLNNPLSAAHLLRSPGYQAAKQAFLLGI